VVIDGAIDAMAMKLHFHDKKIHKENRKSGAAGELLDTLEQLRVESLGSRIFKGAAKNIEQKNRINLIANGYSSEDGARAIPVAEVVAVFAREAITGKTPKEAQEIIKIWEAHIRSNLQDLLNSLGDKLENQAEFAHAINQMVDHLDFAGGGQAADEPQPDAVASKLSEQEEKSSEQEQDFHANPKAQSVTGEEQNQEPEQNKDENMLDDISENEDESSGRAHEPNVIEFPKSHPYAPYITQFDEIIKATDLATISELSELRSQLDSKLILMKDITHKLAIRLQRKLQSQQIRGWKFHAEEGILDSNKLTQIIVDPSYEFPYKYEKETTELNTVVSILIDNSGSMRGRPITLAALSADILTRTLERCGIRVEILGFTTKEWKGGQSRKLWAKNNSPENPGRLNDLMHIVYKQADTPYRTSRRNLGLMLKEGILKENIDGEALLWAHERLLARPERRKILMVISDGAPVDDSTLSANYPQFLEQHLKETITAIENYSDVELLAIGIGHDVNSYYSNAATLTNADQLGDTMIHKISELFDLQSGSRMGVRINV
jgi:cobaltochelatase CobT